MGQGGGRQSYTDLWLEGVSQPRAWESTYQADGVARGGLEEWREPGVLPLAVRAGLGWTWAVFGDFILDTVGAMEGF